MAWTRKSAPKNSGLVVLQEEVTLGDTTTVYSSQLPDDVGFYPDGSAVRKVLISFNASAVSGTNLDIAVQGRFFESGPEVTLLDAVVADITATGENSAIFDLNAYPAALYRFSAISDADETANTLTITVLIPPKSQD